MTDYKLHAEIFGKSCFNCNFIACDTEPEDAYTDYWCSKAKKIIMKRTATRYCHCDEWTLRSEEV